MTTWNPHLYEDKHSFVWQRGAGLIELLAPRAGERILDLGCGTGQLTAEIASRGASVVGLDRSAAMIEHARKNYPAIEFVVGDAARFNGQPPFDAVFSNAALHWIKPAEPVVENIARALRPGGRFLAEFGGRGNVARIVGALERQLRAFVARPDMNPWYFPGIGEYVALLEKHALEVEYAHLFDRPTALEGTDGMRNWVVMFGGAFLSAVPEERRGEFLSAVENDLKAESCRDGTWYADYRRLRVAARKRC